MSQQEKNQKPKRQLNTYARFSGIAIQMLAIIIVGTYVGVKLDESYPNKNDICTLVFTLTSVIISIIYVIRRIIAVSKSEEK